MDLIDYRALIDETDDRILELFRERMAIALKIAQHKKEHGLGVTDAGREKAKLADVREKAGEELGEYAEKLFGTLMEVSRAYQNNAMNPAVTATEGAQATKEG